VTWNFAKRTGWNLTTNACTRALEDHRRSGGELLDLTASNPTTIGLSYDESCILGALAKKACLTYEPTPKGLFAARQAIAGYYADRGTQIDPEDLILTTSTSEAYSFLFRLLCDPGDAVLVPTPSYPLFDFLADLQDVRLVPYELVYDHGWQMDFRSLEQALTRAANCKAVLVVHPNNPTGSFVKPHEAAELASFCEHNSLSIIADEVFLDYSFQQQQPLSFAGLSGSTALCFALSGLSKISGLPQMKVAWIAVAGPEELKTQALDRLEVIADTYLSMNAPVQWAVPEMLAQRHPVQRQLVARMEANLAELDRQLGAQKLCSRLEVEGGWYVVLRVPARGSDEELTISLLRETGVLVQPGHFYDLAGEGHLVLSLITPQETFAQGIERLLRFISEA
jgi:aspartate/methionine/tyrosine aminotransferase